MMWACAQDDDDSDDDFNTFYILDDEITIEMDGEITSASLDELNEIYEQYPQIQTISIRECEGSSDDESNFLLMKRVHQLKLNTHLQDDAVIASGGVDLFLSGHTRSKGKNTRIGVHAWSDDENAATDFPPDPLHPQHKPYIKSYQSIGFSADQAQKLYFFIINAAVAEDIHWMTEEEIQRFCFIGQTRCARK